jgi:hypothetical protein
LGGEGNETFSGLTSIIELVDGVLFSGLIEI